MQINLHFYEFPSIVFYYKEDARRIHYPVERNMQYLEYDFPKVDLCGMWSCLRFPDFFVFFSEKKLSQ